MSKKKKKHGKDPKTPSFQKEVDDFIELTPKKYRKNYGEDYMSKKEVRAGYFGMLAGYIPSVITWLLKYGHVEKSSKLMDKKHDIYLVLSDNDFVKYLKDEIKNGEKIEGSEYLSAIILDMIKEAEAEKKEEEAKNPDKVVTMDMDDLIELSQLCSKKKLKKMKKAGVADDLAFDLVSVLPTAKLLKHHQIFRLGQVMQIIYAYSKSMEIDFGATIKYIIKPEYYPQLITYLLLERKADFVEFDDKQKEFFNSVTEWCFNTMEDYGKTGAMKEIEQIPLAYFTKRKADKAENKDANRRFFLGQIPPEFEHVNKVLAKLRARDSSIEEFL